MVSASTDPMKPYGAESSGGALVTTAAMLKSTQTAGLVSMPWELMSVSADGRRIEVSAVSGDGWCRRHAGFTVTVGARHRMTIAAWSRERHGQKVCSAMLQIGAARLTLPYPASASNPLVHAPVAADATP